MPKKRKTEVIPFFSKFYIDNEARRLKEELRFNPYECLRHSIKVRLIGKTQLETLLGSLFKMYGLVREFVGVIKNELINYDKNVLRNGGFSVEPLINSGYLREKKIKGKAVVFPTEELLETQNVAKYLV